jgi:hypothetical protein
MEVRMIRSLTTVLQQFRQDVAAALAPETVREACVTAGHRWRERQLDPVTTVHLFVLQWLHRNTACAHLPRLTGRTFSVSADCQARVRLPLAVLQRVLERTAQAVPTATDITGRWRGHRTGLVDGTGVSMPDTPDLQRAFGQPTDPAAGCGFPVARVYALFHAGTGFLTRIRVAPLRTHEAAHVADLHPGLETGNGLVGDRAFGSFAHLAGLVSRQLRGVFRVTGLRVVDFTPERTHPPRWNGPSATGRSRSRWVRSLGTDDPVVEWFKGYQRPPWMTAAAFAALPITLTVRELRYATHRPGFRVQTVTLVTTRLDPVAYPATALAELYRSRWRVETNFAHLKTTLAMDVLRCQTEAGVRKELTLSRWFTTSPGRSCARRAGDNRSRPIGLASWMRYAGWRPPRTALRSPCWS